MFRSIASFCRTLFANRFAQVALVGITALAMSATAAQAVIIYPDNDGFEVPNQNSSFTYNPVGASWTFVGNSGIAANGSPFNVQNAPNGNNDSTTSANGQAGLVQGGNGSTSGGGASYFFQSLDLSSLTYSGTLTVSWLNEARTGQQHDYNVILRNNTLSSDVVLGTFASTLGNAFTSQVTAPVDYDVTHSYSLYFVGINSLGGDRTSFIDNVLIDVNEIKPVPEPNTLILLGLGTLAFAARRRRR